MKHRHLLRTALIAATATLGLLGPVSVATAASPAPEMSVTITDGLKTVESGTKVTYTTEVKNLGVQPVDAKVVLTVPSYVSVKSGGGGTVKKSDTTWSITVSPRKASTLELTGTIGTIPKTEVRVTAVASVYVEGVKPSPLIRTADANRIAGVADTPKPAPTDSSASASTPALGWVSAALITAGIVVLAAIIATVIIVRRRQNRSRRRRTGL